MKRFIIILFSTALLSGLCFMAFVNKKTCKHTILSVDKIEATEGSSTNFRTTVYYQVSTDKGAYHIRTTGVNAAPQCSGIKKDSTYVLVTRGINIPLLGVYPCIIEVKEESK